MKKIDNKYGVKNLTLKKLNKIKCLCMRCYE